MQRLVIAFLCALCLPATAVADGDATPPTDGSYPWQYTWKCDNGESVTTSYDHQLSPEEQASERASFCDSPAPSGTEPQTTAPPKPLELTFDKAALMRETLVDLRANRFAVRLRCGRECKVGELVQFGWDLPNGKVRIITLTSKPKRLPAASLSGSLSSSPPLS